MYDRKTWVILVICGSLLAVNLYYQGQEQARKRATEQREEALRKANAPDKEAVRESHAELAVETPPPPTEEEQVVLTNKQIEYTLTNIGGGVKFADFQHEFEVGDKTKRVRANRFGSGPIGAGGGDTPSVDEHPSGTRHHLR